MPERGSVREAAPNMLDPMMMKAEERLREMARILAEGYLRLCLIRGQKSATRTPTAREKHLDSSGDQSDGCAGG